MRRILFMAAGLALVPVLGLISVRAAEVKATAPGKVPPVAAKPLPKPAPEEGSCGNHGTSVVFVDTPSEAARKALKEEKLVLVLHVSGHFEDSGVT